ncbi:ribokinase [Clostridium sp. Cult3]|uniref:ribokinase n=1 Tax=Clostridium sp. Cult3 TaxID=2079004 RepID=UPI001F00B5AA|nr:ribokinase [Clostridium sp. Cult3]MCF6460837.1 ribokinase [Clostridium sp. Cult3]
MFDILVIGSINADLVFTSDIMPKAGETVIGKDFRVVPGGKGANQAIAAARLGKKVGFIGCVGDDDNGKMLIDNFKENNVETRHIRTLEGIPSGVANIVISEDDNSIIVIPGANYYITKEMIDENIDIIMNSKLVVLQHEIPMDIIEYIVDICFENRIKVILNPAPAIKLKQTIIDKVDYLTPNEHECKIVFDNSNIDELLSNYPNKLIITKGDKGVVYHNGNRMVNIPAINVDVVDTTGAGDTFNGALATAIVNGYNIDSGIEFANKVAAISVTKFGAQSGMPYWEECFVDCEP